MKENYIIKNNRIISRLIDGKMVILDAEGKTLYILNEIGTKIWELCDGSNRIKDIVSKLCHEYDIEKDIAKKDVLDFVNQLLQADLLFVSKDSGQE